MHVEGDDFKRHGAPDPIIQTAKLQIASKRSFSLFLSLPLLFFERHKKFAGNAFYCELVPAIFISALCLASPEFDIDFENARLL